MKKIVCVALVLCSIIQTQRVEIDAQVASSYCVLSTSDNYIIDSENDEHTQSVASISKVMTAIVVLENIDITTEVTIDDIVLQAYGSSVYLQVGDVYTVEELLYGLMLRSGNDAAIQLASIVAKDVETFVGMMNDKAKELGLETTVFSNPSGLDEEDGGNISTSCEMALIMSYAMNNETFKQITSTTMYHPRAEIAWSNKNRFLGQYEFATGGKTGYTKLAKRTLVTSSEKEGMEVVVVTLNSSDDFVIHEQLHEYAHENYEVIPILKEGKYTIEGKEYELNAFGMTINKGTADSIHIESEIQDYLEILITYGDRKETLMYE